MDKNSFIEMARQLAYVQETGKPEINLYGKIIGNLKRDSHTIRKAYKSFSAVPAKDRSLLPSSSEWLLDNYFIVNEQINLVKNGLTSGFYKDLIKLNNGGMKNYPRVYGLAWEMLAFKNQSLDFSELSEFVLEYETVTPLTSAEIWALPIMLRLILISNLALLLEQSILTYQTRLSAQQTADRILNLEGNLQTNFVKILSRYFYGKKKPDTTFLVWLLRGLRDQDSKVAPAIHWLERYISQEDLNIEEAIKAENHKQAAKRITVGNIVNSLRMVSTVSWKDFFESTSLVEKILRQDPAGLYKHMDFESRDRYRHIVEDLSRYSNFNEQEVARRILKMTQDKQTSPYNHIGYYLAGNGIFEIRKNLNYRPALGVRVINRVRYHPTLWYLAVWITALFIGLVGWQRWFGTSHPWLLIPLSVPVTAVVNWLTIRLFAPVTLPKLELTSGIPDQAKTLVVIPCQLVSLGETEKLVESLEQIYLANRENNLYFGLLTDFADSKSQCLPEDEPILKRAETLIGNLNNRHDPENKGLFYLLHRPRLYNSREKLWMGWERKRGKLEMLNRFLVTADNQGFERWVGNLAGLKQISYVITVDADTKVPFNSAKKLIGAMLHPLNKPVVDMNKRRVVEGYGIIQPRVDVHAPNAVKTSFSRLFASEAGLDPYHSLVSNLYQDLFENSVYIGKAIYDVQCFYNCLDRRFPENRLLSHDLLEGLYLRVAFCPEIIFLEDFPASYFSYSKRQHRWIRGDWQIASWIFSRDLDYQDKWKIFDNLRRSAIAPVSVAGFFLLGSDWQRILVLFMLAYPNFQIFMGELFRHSTNATVWESLDEIVAAIKTFGQRLMFLVGSLPYEAYRNLHAILISVFRMIVGGPGILEWTIQSVSENRYRANLRELLNLAKPALLVGLATIYLAPKPIGFVLSGLWIISPLIIVYYSRAKRTSSTKLADGEKKYLYKVGLRTWRFFDEFAGFDNNYLPIDNVQLDPGPKMANRTSPTNIGFLLTSLVSAYDFGWITKSELADRLSKTFATLEKMDKFNGHFYNWYRTDNLQVLYPNYVSTADSGNLAASFLAISTACEQMDRLPERRADLNLLAESFVEILKEDWERLFDSIGKGVDKRLAKILDLKGKNPESLKFNEMISSLEELEFEYLKSAGKDKMEKIKYWRIAMSRLKTTVTSNADTDQIFSQIADKARKYVLEMDFSLLYSTEKRVFSVGYNVSEKKPDLSYYNLLASESRLAGLIAIALRQVSEKHWFELGRPLKKIHGKTVLYSWGGTMFEYLMPNIFVTDFDNTILSQTNREIVSRQIEYAKGKRVPWGISESGYYALDFDYNYQYQQFGVPDLSIKREASENLVIAPYATFLAYEYQPKSAFANLLALNKYKMLSDFGYFEAIDFNPVRLPDKMKFGIVKSHMAHHQGMILASLDNYLNNYIWKKRFGKNDLIAGVALLMGEKIPKYASKVDLPAENVPALDRELQLKRQQAIKISGKTETARAAVLSNSEMTTIISNSGAGYSMWKNLDISRYRVDTTSSNWGWFFVISNRQDELIWSATYRPFWKKPDHYHVYFYPHKAEFIRLDGKIETKMVLSLAIDENIEFRELILTNKGTSTVHLEVTDYREIVLLPHRDDVAHPAFGKLFMESEYDKERQLILWKRRNRSGQASETWYWHTLKVSGSKSAKVSHDTSREAFLGRGNDIFTAQAFGAGLSNFSGVSLDPIASLQVKVSIKPGDSAKLTYMAGVTTSKDDIYKTVDLYRDPQNLTKAYQLAEIHSQIEQRHLGISPNQITLFQKLGSKITFPERNLGADKKSLPLNTKGQSDLYAFGISGDYPIVLLKVSSMEGTKIVREILLAHEYLRMKNIRFDLLILNLDKSVYAGEVKREIVNIVDTSLSRPFFDKPGGIYLRDGSLVNVEDRYLWESVARVTIDGSLGSLEYAFDSFLGSTYGYKVSGGTGKFLTGSSLGQQKYRLLPQSVTGFTSQGSEYQYGFKQQSITPLPWSNIMANENFGSLTTLASLGYTWYGNSQQNKLSSWHNDPVSETAGEYLYAKDVSNNSWVSLTPLPKTDKAIYKSKHGFGYSQYNCQTTFCNANTTVWVDKADPVKVIEIKISNKLDVIKKLRLVYYVELVLGADREQNQFMVNTFYDQKKKVLIAKNYYNNVYADKPFFVGSSESLRGYSGDRTEFLGLGGSVNSPHYLSLGANETLSKRTGYSLDPAAVMELEVILNPRQEKTIYIYMGQEAEDRLPELLQKYNQYDMCQYCLQDTKSAWKHRLGKIKVKTDNKSLNLLINGWLQYQTLSGRFWGRTGFYQAGGAIGFRDQLQDCLSIIYTDTELVKRHILDCARHQFIQGDVMHWWHPDTNMGVRTRVSDDFLWLVFAVHQYIKISDDLSILDEMVEFMDMAPLEEGQQEKFDRGMVTREKTSLYDHCLKALDRGMRIGGHGLPLMGSGDWNDGMNKVGDLGKGESVWLAWFQIAVYEQFTQIARERNDRLSLSKYTKYAKDLRKAVENYGWDGKWYLRAYDDNGQAIGSNNNQEAKIDLISQVWSTMIEEFDKQRSETALSMVEEKLVDRRQNLVKLLSPPYNKSENSPGYIQGYVPGIRENGAQYTHAAVWLPLAYLKMGNPERAVEILDMINPVKLGGDEEGRRRYRGEPYVLAGDVYSHAQHAGRSGWTWYTGSAAWMYHIVISELLGLKISGDRLNFAPCVPANWNKFLIDYRYHNCIYKIDFVRKGASEVYLEGKKVKSGTLKLDTKKRYRKVLVYY